MTKDEVLEVMKDSEQSVERGPGHIKVTYTYPLQLTASNPGGHNQAECYRESVDSLLVGVHTNNMAYAKANFAATGNKVVKCPNGFDYPSDKEEQGYLWYKKSTGEPYIRAKFENIAPQYKQRSRYFIDGVEVSYADVVDAYNRGEFTKSAIYQISDRDLFDTHIAVGRVSDIKVVVKESVSEAVEEGFKLVDAVEAVDCVTNEKYHVKPIYKGEALVTLSDEDGKSTRVFTGDFLDGYDLYDVNGKLIHKANMDCDTTNESLNESEADYGWKIPTEKVWDIFDIMKEELGEEELLLSMAKAIGNEKLADILAFIAKQFDMSDLIDGEGEIDEFDDFDDLYTGM